MTTFLWCDVETTGLDPHSDALLALGLRHTTADLVVLDELEVYFPIRATDIRLARMSPQVRSWHTKSGLLERCAVTNSSAFQDALPGSQGRVLPFLQRVCPAGADMDARPRIAGSTISFDRSFLRHFWPEYLEHVHYRSIDVSTLLELTRTYRPELMTGAPGKRELHTPLADVDDSIALFSFLRGKLGLVLP